MSDDRIMLTERQKKAQRSRSVAIALALVAFVLIVYLGSMVRFGATLAHLPH